MTKPLTIDDLVRMIGEVAAVDYEQQMTATRKRQGEESIVIQKRHQAERKAIEDAVMQAERQIVELRAAIQLTKDGMPALAALMQVKGEAELISFDMGKTHVWVIRK